MTPVSSMPCSHAQGCSPETTCSNGSEKSAASTALSPSARVEYDDFVTGIAEIAMGDDRPSSALSAAGGARHASHAYRVTYPTRSRVHASTVHDAREHVMC